MSKVFFLLLLSILTTPQIANAQSLQLLLVGIIGFINNYVIPLLFALAFLFFIYNVYRYFIVESHEEKGREKAKLLAVYAVAAFVLIIIFLGLINLLASSIGLDGCNMPLSDYQLMDPAFSGPHNWCP